MKNSILFTLALMLTLASSAQESVWKIGFKVNPNISWIKPDAKYINAEGSNLRFGFSLMIDKHFTDNYAFGTGLNIFQTGGKLSYLRKTNEVINGFSGSYDVISRLDRSYKLQYGEIPLTLKLRTNEIGYITYWGQFGLGLGFNIRSKSDDSIDYVSQNTGDASEPWVDSTINSLEVEDEDIKDDISIFRTSLIIGAGIEYSLSGTTSIIAGVTFNNGFSDCLRGKGVQTDDRDAIIYEGTGAEQKPREYDLKGYGNFIELNVGILF